MFLNSQKNKTPTGVELRDDESPQGVGDNMSISKFTSIVEGDKEKGEGGVKGDADSWLILDVGSDFPNDLARSSN